MFDPFDVLRLENDDQPMWEASAPTIDDARTLVQKLAASHPANYLIFCQRTGTKIVIEARGIGSVPALETVPFADRVADCVDEMVLALKAHAA